MKPEILKAKDEIEKLKRDIKKIEFYSQNITERILELSKNIDKLINDFGK